jgi:hypothetical protein
MGVSSDFQRAERLFPHSRIAVMYPPKELDNRPISEIETDLQRIAAELSPCDVVFADIEAGTPDDRIRAMVQLCRQISEASSAGPVAA